VSLYQLGLQAEDLASRIEKMPNALSAKQLRTLLNISKTTLYEKVAQGSIPYYRIGTIIRFDPVRIASWLRAQEVGTLAVGRSLKRAA
jgi:excisionase family DNA binding protein